MSPTHRAVLLQVLVTVLKRLQMLLVSWLLQKPLFLIAKGGTRVYIAGFAGCTLLSLVKQLGAPPVTCTAQQVARAGTSLQLLKVSEIRLPATLMPLILCKTM